jgi:2',3'-cyclic-nucleotide 2'-phosphodiesterase
VRILAIGDVIGKPGRDALKALLPDLKQEQGLTLVMANGENAAGGIGLTSQTAGDLLACGVDVITSGNHIWAQREAVALLNDSAPILRPLNYPAGAPGRGYFLRDGIAVVSLIGRTFMTPVDDPFRAMDKLLSELPSRVRTILVDFHAEATSEKVALGRYLDGRVSGFFGTHTHVPTADAQIFPRGTAYVTDLGMVGPRESVIGDDVEAVIDRFLTQIPRRLPVAEGKHILFNSVIVEIDDDTGRAQAIERCDREIDI